MMKHTEMSMLHGIVRFLTFFSILNSICITSLHAEESQKKDSLARKGSPIVHLFSHFSTDISSKPESAGFDFTRAYFGYHYNFNEHFSGRIVIDAAVPQAGSDRNSIYLKNAYVTWTDSRFTVDAGLLCLRQFIHTQENWWEKRYVTNSLTDRTGMFNGADYGIDFVYSPNSKVSLDFAFTNGEGFKSLNRNTSFKYDLGILWKPCPALVFRCVGEWYTKSQNLLPADYTGPVGDQFISAVFAGAKIGDLKLGVEGGMLWNKNFIRSQNMWCYSVYAIYNITEKFNVFARMDQTGSEKPLGTSWNSTDGFFTVAGAEYRFNDLLKISPNFRNLCPGAIKDSDTYFFINLEFKLY